MPTTSFDKDSIKASIIGKLQRYNGRTIEEASNGQIYRALASTVRDQIMQKWMISREERKTNNNKRLFYLSVEFLMGRSLYTNILNLVSLDAYKQALDELHIDVDKVLQEEPEPALGNGGLGRLAACFMDSLASLDLPEDCGRSAGRAAGLLAGQRQRVGNARNGGCLRSALQRSR